MTALLAVIAELLVDDPAAQLRCRREVAERDEHLPRWIAALPRVDVYRAVRRTNVFGDVDEVVIGMRLDGGHELTVAVRIDHNLWSSVADAGVVPDPIDEALARVAELSSDTDVSEMTLADARVWIEDALNKPTLAPETDTWPLYRALVQWLVGRLPEGGEHRSPAGEWESDEELCDRFFATSSAAPFTDPSHRELLLELFETGTGDPLRWSAARVEQRDRRRGLRRGPHSVGGRAGRSRSATRIHPIRSRAERDSRRTDVTNTRYGRRAEVELQAGSSEAGQGLGPRRCGLAVIRVSTLPLAKWRQWRHNGAMPSVQIKDVPDDTHRVLRERAARAHQSLQEYLRSRLIADANQPTLEEVFDRVATRRGGKVSFADAVSHLRAERDRR